MIKPFEPHKIDDVYGTVRSKSYVHEGWDMNGLKGGDTDNGTPLKAVCDGEIVHTSKSNKDYGNLLVLKVETEAGTRWVRYCHLDRFEKTKGSVKEGEVICYMGSTGNSEFAHLHLDVIKEALPSWRFWPRDKQSLAKFFEDPLIFFTYKGKPPKGEPMITQKEIDDLRLARDTNWNLYQETLTQLNTVKDTLSKVEGQRSEALELLRTRNEEYMSLQGKNNALQEQIDTLQVQPTNLGALQLITKALQKALKGEW